MHIMACQKKVVFRFTLKAFNHDSSPLLFRDSEQGVSLNPRVANTGMLCDPSARAPFPSCFPERVGKVLMTSAPPSCI